MRPIVILTIFIFCELSQGVVMPSPMGYPTRCCFNMCGIWGWGGGLGALLMGAACKVTPLSPETTHVFSFPFPHRAFWAKCGISYGSVLKQRPHFERTTLPLTVKVVSCEQIGELTVVAKGVLALNIR